MPRVARYVQGDSLLDPVVGAWYGWVRRLTSSWKKASGPTGGFDVGGTFWGK